MDTMITSAVAPHEAAAPAMFTGLYVPLVTPFDSGGDDALIAPLLALGAHGAILASAHFATGEFAALIGAWRSGDLITARALGSRLAPLSAALFAEPNPVVVKAVLHAQGRIPTPDVRLPLLPAAPASLAAAKRYLNA